MCYGYHLFPHSNLSNASDLSHWNQASLPFPGLAECGADSLAPFISLPARYSVLYPPYLSYICLRCVICMGLRDDIKKKIILNGHCLLSSDPPSPSRLNGQGGPKTTFNAYYRIKFKLILIMKILISVMKLVINLMMVMKMTKKQLVSKKIPLLGTITW